MGERPFVAPIGLRAARRAIMSNSFLCNGCGQRVAIPEAYARRKMQCPHCGVMCERPATMDRASPRSATRAAPPPAAPLPKPAPIPDETPPPSRPSAPLIPDETPPPPRPDPNAPIKGDFLDPDDNPLTAAVGAGDERVTLSCTACGHRMQVAAAARARYRSCHRCGARLVETAVKRPAAAGTRSRPSAALLDDDDDGQAYEVAGGAERRCPDCQRVVSEEANVCASCGFNLVTGEKAGPRTYSRIERHWQSGLPLRRRVLIWVGGQFLFLLINVILVSFLGWASVGSIIYTWVVFTLMFTFLLGTYDTIDLTRNEKGKIRLVQTWYVLFIPRSPKRLALNACDGIQLCQSYHVGFLDWMILVFLIPVGVFPAIIWWFGFMHRESFYVALTRDQGYAEHYLYRGWNKEFAQDIAHTLVDATGLAYDGF